MWSYVWSAITRSEDIYYFAETKADYDANMMEKGRSGYIEYVIANGTKARLSKRLKPELGVVTVEKVFTNLIGENIISAVSVSASGKSLNTTTFVGLGLEWEDITDGYYQFRKRVQSSLGFWRVEGV